MSASTTPTSIAAATTSRGGTLAARQRRQGWLMVAPSVVLILGLGIFPLLYSLWLSFVRWDLQVREHPFVGLANYAAAVADPRVWSSLAVTLGLMVVGVGVEFLLGLALALVLVDELRGKRVVIPLLTLPVMMVPIVATFSWKMLWDAQYGVVNQVIGILLGHPVLIAWLAKTDTAFIAVAVTEIWQWTPFMFLILLAGLAGISPELYEAAAIDGAGWWSALRHITLPALSRVIAVAILFRAVDVFKIFDVIFGLTLGGPGTSTATISYYLYELGFKFFRLGYASSISYLVLILLSLAATLYVTRFLREERT